MLRIWPEFGGVCFAVAEAVGLVGWVLHAPRLKAHNRHKKKRKVFMLNFLSKRCNVRLSGIFVSHPCNLKGIIETFSMYFQMLAFGFT
jgi:hypothetical protein